MAGIVRVINPHNQSQQLYCIFHWAMNKTVILDSWIIGTYLCS